MAFSTKTKIGTFWLHRTRMKNSKNFMYFFKRQKSGAVDKPKGRKVKVTKTGLPVLAKS